MNVVQAVFLCSSLVFSATPQTQPAPSSAPADKAATTRPSGAFVLWAVDDGLHINPETGKAFEENPGVLPGCISGDYRSRNDVWSRQDRTVDLSGARNEVVAFQLIIDGQGDGYKVEATPLRGPNDSVIPLANIELFREWYIFVDSPKTMKGCAKPLGTGWYPDVCIPLSQEKYGNGFAIPSKDFHTPDSERFCEQKNQAIWVDIHVPPKTPPGSYKGQIQVRNRAGVSQAVQVQLKVWDFAIPAEMHMIAHLVNYGGTVAESDPVMYAYYRMAAEHRTYINDDKVIPAEWDGKKYDWTSFDKRFGPMFDGSAFQKGPTAGVPIPAWAYPINFRLNRPDKGKGFGTTPDWPVAVQKSEKNYGVVFTDETRTQLAEAMRKFEEHFVEKGWTKTKIVIYQDSLDEPGFWMQGEKLKAGEQQARSIYETAKIVKDAGLKQFVYRFDVGSAFSNNKLDLDGNGTVEGAMDTAKYLGPVVPLWYVHGLSVKMPAAEHLKKMGDAVCFYNGFEPRVGSNALPAELLGWRQWSLAAYRCGLAGWVDWQFRADRDVPMRLHKEDVPVFHRTQNQLQRNLYIYRGDAIGATGQVFASMRLKSARRGAQDFEMLRLLAIKDGSDKRAQQMANKVCRATFAAKLDTTNGKDDVGGEEEAHKEAGRATGWSHDPMEWEAFRRELGEALAR